MTRVVLALFLAAACSSPPEPTPEELQLDAAAPAACLSVDIVQRAFECKAICATPNARCPGASGAACLDECRRWARGTFYCPEHGP